MTKIASTGLVTTTTPPTQPRRRGRIAKLPKMTNSERGKYYRKKNKQHELALEDAVAALRKQVHDLQQFQRVRDELLYRNPYDPCESIAGSIYSYFVTARDGGLQYDASFQPEPAVSAKQSAWKYSPSGYSSGPQDASAKTFQWGDAHVDTPDAFLFFDLLSFDVEGCVAAPIVVMRGTLHAKYTQQAIDRLFPHLQHYPDLLDVLLDKEVRYPCTYHFCFGEGGAFHHKLVEADYVHGLQALVGNLQDVVWLLDGSHRYAERRDSLEEILRGPSPMAIDFILS